MTKIKDYATSSISAPTLAIIHITMAILLGWLAPLPIPVPSAVPWIGLVLAASGLVLGILSLVEFRRARVSQKPAKALVTSGIYSYTRNPVYLGFVLMLIGIPLNMGIYWGLLLVWPLITFTNNLIIKYEEAHLKREFKEQYTEYSARVKRWL